MKTRGPIWVLCTFRRKMRWHDFPQCHAPCLRNFSSCFCSKASERKTWGGFTFPMDPYDMDDAEVNPLVLLSKIYPLEVENVDLEDDFSLQLPWLWRKGKNVKGKNEGGKTPKHRDFWLGLGSLLFPHSCQKIKNEHLLLGFPWQNGK